MSFNPLGPTPTIGPMVSPDLRVTPVWQQWLDALRNLVSPAQAYTPILTPLLNLDSVTPATCWYQQRGNYVSVFGQFGTDATVAAANTAFYMTLPIAASLNDQFDLAGTATSNGANESARIYADIVGKRAAVNWPSTTAAALGWSFQFAYVLR